MHCFFYCLVFYIPTAPKIFAISSGTDKNSNHNFARLSACCLHGKRILRFSHIMLLSLLFYCLVFYISTATNIYVTKKT